MNVTPERPEDRSDEENGVLPDAVGVDTTSIDFLGAATAQVNLVVPGVAEDDDTDDDVIGDEVDMAALLGDDQEAAADAPDEAEDPVSDAPRAYAPDHEAIEDAVVIEDEEPEESAAEPPTAHVPAPEAVQPMAVEAPEPPAAEFSEPPTDERTELQAEEHAGPQAEEHAGPQAEEHAGPQAGTAASGSPADEIPTRADHPVDAAVPATRREAHHTVPFVRAREGERVAARTAPELASKRLGEFEPDRESADLLTADRLLDQSRLARPEPEGGWPRFMYSLTGGRVNLGDGKRARARKDLDRRIASPLPGGARFVPVLSRKGGVGKTTITTLLGMALADARDDRIVAIDANPDRGTLADRIDKPSGHTVRDLVRTHDAVTGYNDISTIVTRDRTRLDVLASDADPRVSEAFSDEDYEEVARIAAHYYSIVLTDTGTGIVHSVMGATLGAADQLVVVSGLSVDEARLASETLTWLETNGFREQVRGAIVVLNTSRPGAPLVRAGELESHFGTRVRHVVRMPYDPHIATGSAIVFRDLQPATREAARALAAAVVSGLRGESGAA